MTTPDTIKRILKKVVCNPMNSGCWEHTGAWHDGKGYKKVSVEGQDKFVHRVLFEWFWRRRLRADVQLDHACCNRACCNPLHLTPMKNKRNSQLRSKRAKQKVTTR